MKTIRGILVIGLLIAVNSVFCQKNKGYKKDSLQPFLIVEHMPEFPGGKEALFDFLKANLNYPQNAKDSAIKGTVFVQFLVNKAGNLSGFKVMRGIGGGCDEEAIRVIKLMPNKWKPGIQNKYLESVYFQLPIKFPFSEESKKQFLKEIK